MRLSVYQVIHRAYPIPRINSTFQFLAYSCLALYIRAYDSLFQPPLGSSTPRCRSGVCSRRRSHEKMLSTADTYLAMRTMT